MRQRYFVTNRQGKSVVYDRELDLVIATCNYREQAVLVAKALNNQETAESRLRERLVAVGGGL